MSSGDFRRCYHRSSTEVSLQNQIRSWGGPVRIIRGCSCDFLIRPETRDPVGLSEGGPTASLKLWQCGSAVFEVIKPPHLPQLRFETCTKSLPSYVQSSSARERKTLHCNYICCTFDTTFPVSERLRKSNSYFISKFISTRALISLFPSEAHMVPFTAG